MGGTEGAMGRVGGAKGVGEEEDARIFPRTVAPASGLVKVHVDALQLEVRVPVVGARGVNAVLVSNHLPKLGTNLVTTLPTLQVN